MKKIVFYLAILIAAIMFFGKAVNAADTAVVTDEAGQIQLIKEPSEQVTVPVQPSNTTKKSQDKEKMTENIKSSSSDKNLSSTTEKKDEKKSSSSSKKNKSKSKFVKANKERDYVIKVNLEHNCVTVYTEENGQLKPFKAMVCSAGRDEHETPEGEFKTYEYYESRLMVDNTYGRYAVRFNGQIMFHSVPYLTTDKDSLEWDQYNLLGERASLGCIRLCVGDAKWIYDNCKKGTKVIVYSDKSTPGPLGKPKVDKIPENSPNKNWDPTDLTPENPWLVIVE